jgi:hypothetical protein
VKIGYVTRKRRRQYFEAVNSELGRFIVVFGLKRLIMSVQNLFFARPAPKKPSPPLFSITGCGKRRQDVVPAPFFTYFTPAAFCLLLKVKSELASCLMMKGTFKKSV